MADQAPDGDELGETGAARALQQAQKWVAAADRSEGVGRRHHTVPAFYLRHFAKRDQVLVRRPGDGPARLSNVLDLSEKDFYTFVAEDGETDGRLEQILQVVEDAAAPILARLRSPLLTPRQLDPTEAAALAQFLSFQLVRGVRRRRELELMADYLAKTQVRRRPASGGPGKRHHNGRTAGGEQHVTDVDLVGIRVVPHPNEHLRSLGPNAEAVLPHLVGRPACVIEVNAPLLLTCDEPVLILSDETVQHLPECALTERQRGRALRRAAKRRQKEVRETLHVYPTRRAGVVGAREIGLPLSPRRLLVLGPHGGDNNTPFLRASGADNEQVIEEVNRRIVEQAYQWVVGHPDHPGLHTMELPPPRPLVAICDGGSPLARDLDRAPSPHHPQRLRRDWRL